MENLIEELTKVNPSNLSEEGLKLFNKINEIIDKNKELEEKNKKKSIEIICYQEELENCIPVSLVEETIEERKLWLSSNDIGYKDDYVLEVLQELLEKRK